LLCQKRYKPLKLESRAACLIGCRCLSGARPRRLNHDTCFSQLLNRKRPASEVRRPGMQWIHGCRSMRSFQSFRTENGVVQPDVHRRHFRLTQLQALDLRSKMAVQPTIRANVAIKLCPVIGPIGRFGPTHPSTHTSNRTNGTNNTNKTGQLVFLAYRNFLARNFVL
jgi:hypothetical protein